MRRWFLGFLFGAATWLSAGAAPVADVSAADAKSVQAVVAAQLKAFAADDASAAFAFAAPTIREKFGTAERFFAMVRGGYPVVYRPASIAFLKPERLGGVIVQGVHLTDADGVLWLAIYQLERQPDRSWRISACVVAPAEGRVA